MIEVENLAKVFVDKKHGEKRAVEGVSFSVQPGEIFGLLGPNGAGKTTTTRILATILAPSAGTARINHHDIVRDAEKVRASIGYLTGGAGLYERLTARELLRYFGDLYGLETSRREVRIAQVAKELDMGEFLDRKCEKLSTGQKQRVSIARAVLHEPPVLFFDEPTSGLDVLAARTVVTFIRRCKSEGKTILFSTHIMSEVEALCDRIGVIYEGKIAGIGTLEELRTQTGKVAFESVFLKLIGMEETDTI
jgi:sodium transport system ATP-binding protein